MLNRYPLWKYLLLGALILWGVIYALPSFFGENPSVQISPTAGTEVTPAVVGNIRSVLNTAKLTPLSITRQKDDNLLVRFDDVNTQLKARELISAALGPNYIVALNLASQTPKWLAMIGAVPMKFGLDLRGGVHFLLDVDINAVVKAREEGDIRAMGDQLRTQNIRYAGISSLKPDGVLIRFREQANLDRAKTYLSKEYRDYTFVPTTRAGELALKANLSQEAMTHINTYTLDQTMTILRNRVNQLGVSDAVVQIQGKDKISVDLPGIQDTTRAKNILGKTATLRFQLVDTTSDVQSAVAGDVPFGTRLYTYEGQPILLKNQVILQGSAITYATAGIGQDGRPNVQIRLGGGGESLFQKVTAANVGKPLAVVYVETKLEKKLVNGKIETQRRLDQKVISVATIQSALGNNFQITGLSSERYAQNLALLLRSGALTAPVNIIQETTVGPSLGKANIEKGVVSVVVAGILVIIFMAFYYGLFGLVADVALVLNMIFIIAVLSLIGASLTLPGIAGMVLTLGMAVDANVLINERIREELRNGMSPQASIHAGYGRAFITIVDANVTTLIVALVLFSLGSGAVKGFAITLIIGLLASMVTAIFFTRAVINLIYGGRSVSKLSIGMRRKELKKIVAEAQS